MAILNFPNSPQTDDQYTGDNGTTYIYDGVKWVGRAAGGAAGTNSIQNGTHTVQVDVDGNLVLPVGSVIKDAAGDPVGGGASLGDLVAVQSSLYSSTDSDVYISSFHGEGPGFSYLKLPNDANALTNPVVLTNYKAGGAGVNIVTSNPYNEATEHTWNFGSDGNITLPQGSTLGETSTTTMITPPGAAAGQSLVIRPTAGQFYISADHPDGFVPGETITITIGTYSGAQTGTLDYEFTEATSQQLGRATTGTLTFTSEAEKTITWTVPAQSSMTTFTFSLIDATGFDGQGGVYVPGLPNFTITLDGTSGEVSHVHLMSGDPTTVDLYLGDDDQYVKIEKNAGNVVIGTNTNTNHWTFGTDGDLVLPEGKTIRDIAGADLLGAATGPQYGYFNELKHFGDNNRVNGEAVVVDSDSNSYVSYSYYNDNLNKDVGGVAKFSVTGEKLWSVNLESPNTDARNLKIASLEYLTTNGNALLVAFGSYYDNNTGRDVAVIYAVNPADGSVGLSLIDAELTTSLGMALNDGVVGIDGNSFPFVVVAGTTYDQKLIKTLTPLAGSTVNKLYFSWSDINATDLAAGDQLIYNTGGYYGFSINAAETVATPDGTTYDGLFLMVSTTENGSYVITRSNGYSGAINSWSVPISLRVLGSSLGGANNTKYTATSDAITGNRSLFFDANTYPDLANVQDGWYVSGPGITGYALLSNVQVVTSYFRFDVPNGVTVSPGEVYTLDGGGNDMTFDFDNSVFAGNSSNINAAVSNIRGTTISNVYCSAFNSKDWSEEIGNALNFEYQLNNQAFIARFGNDSWTKSIGATSYDRINSVVIDSGGNTYAAGYVNNGTRASLIVKYNISGVQQWAVYIDPSNNTGNDLTSIDLLADGSLIAVDRDGTITKLSSDTGAIFWQVTVDSGPSWDSDFKGTATPDGDYIITNYEDNDYTMYVLRVSGTDGSSVWTKRISRVNGNQNGEIYPQNDFDAQYIDCNDTYVTIGATTYIYLNNNNMYAGLVFSLPLDGLNVDGTYGEYVVATASMSWTTESTTSVAATVAESPTNVQTNSVNPTSSASNILVNRTTIGGAVDTPTVFAGIERHSASTGDDTIILSLEQNGKFLYYNGNNGSSTIRIPSNNDVALPIGFVVTIVMDDFNGSVIYVDNNTGSQDATINASGMSYNLINNWRFGSTASNSGVYTIMKVDTDRWMLAGPDVTADY